VPSQSPSIDHVEYYCPHCLRQLWPTEEDAPHTCEEHPDGVPHADLVPRNPPEENEE
jgi:hypothetical protein